MNRAALYACGGVSEGYLRSRNKAAFRPVLEVAWIDLDSPFSAGARRDAQLVALPDVGGDAADVLTLAENIFPCYSKGMKLKGMLWLTA